MTDAADALAEMTDAADALACGMLCWARQAVRATLPALICRFPTINTATRRNNQPHSISIAQSSRA
jgi:hypothetical protein